MEGRSNLASAIKYSNPDLIQNFSQNEPVAILKPIPMRPQFQQPQFQQPQQPQFQQPQMQPQFQQPQMQQPQFQQPQMQQPQFQQPQQMQQPQMQSQLAVPVIAALDTYMILGYAVESKYVYLLSAIVFLVVLYVGWNYYNKHYKNKPNDKDQYPEADRSDKVFVPQTLQLSAAKREEEANDDQFDKMMKDALEK